MKNRNITIVMMNGNLSKCIIGTIMILIRKMMNLKGMKFEIEMGIYFRIQGSIRLFMRWKMEK